MESDAIALGTQLAGNITVFRERLGAPENMDIIVRRFRAGALEAAIVAVDGMTDSRTINENILRPCMELPDDAGEQAAPQERVSFLMSNAVSVLPMKLKDNIDDLLADILSGQSVLLCDGCAKASVMDTRGFEKRTIGRPEAEKVVLGAHESFSESLRTSITLIRRIVQREELTTEFIRVGGRMKTRCALLYLRGTADEEMIARVRKRLMDCGSDFPLSAGDIEQVIESHPLSIIPQCVRTERPDRAASFLAEGQIVILTDGSPEALGAPATIYHQLHTPDDASMRWQYGSFLRVIRLLGVLIHLFLPGLYLSVLRFHPELLSAMLLTSVYETGSRVPFPVFLEALLMTLAFDLISEAGLRAPGAMGNALGIVSGLILGQSAVSADIVSPLLLIIVAASGLGGFCVPGYALSVGLKMVQLMMMIAGAMGGLYAMGLLTAALLCVLCAMTSLGSPLTAPVTPKRPRNPDILLRLPLGRQRAKAFYAEQNEQGKNARHMRVHAAFRARACAAGLCVGVQVFVLGTGVGMALSLNAAWLGAMTALPACAVGAALCRRRLVRDMAGAGVSRARALTVCLSLTGCCVFALSALMSLAGQTLLSQAQAFFVMGLTAALLLLAAAGKADGAVRAAYALRLLGPIMPALLLLRVGTLEVDGLFPLLGPGVPMLLGTMLAMTAGAAPVLLLLLPPQVAGKMGEGDVPPAGFFVRRVLFGAAMGVALLFVMTIASTHETIAGNLTWGERLRLTGVGGSRTGLVYFLLTVCQTILIFLHASIMLLSAEQALMQAFAGMARRRAGLLVLLTAAGGSLVLLLIAGMQAAQAVGILAALPACAALLMQTGRREMVDREADACGND